MRKYARSRESKTSFGLVLVLACYLGTPRVALTFCSKSEETPQNIRVANSKSRHLKFLAALLRGGVNGLHEAKAGVLDSLDSLGLLLFLLLVRLLKALEHGLEV